MISIYVKGKDTDSIIYRLDEGIGFGSELNPNFSMIKNGGLDVLEFTVPQDADLPISNDMLVELWIDGIFCESAYVTDSRENNSDTKTITFTCNGFSTRLARKTITKTFTSRTLKQIVSDVETELNAVGILYSSTLINLPTFTVPSMDASDITLDSLMARILDVANIAYTTLQYRWYINKNHILCFDLIEATVLDQLYEGYHFQKPTVNQDKDSLVNVIRFFRTKSSAKSTVEFVAEYSDAQSVAENGEVVKKISYSDYIDTTVCTRIAASILSRYKDPSNQISISDLPVYPDDSGALLSFGKYGINRKPNEYWENITDGESLNDIDTTHAINASVSLDTAHVLMGSKAIKIITHPTTSGYVAFAVNTPILFPRKIRLYAYLQHGASIQLEGVSSFGDMATITLTNTSTNDGWFIIEMNIGDSFGEPVVVYGKNSSDESIAICFKNASNQDATLFGFSHASLRNLATVRVYLGAVESIIWVDKVETQTYKYNRDEVVLDNVKYTSRNGRILADAIFGEKQRDLIKVIEDAIDGKNAITNIFVKE